jgi:pimeloyl-ACP methyl ester carboxylesterase
MFSCACGSGGDPVLFIHGMPTSGRLWSGIVDRMQNQFTCVMVDLPGLGRTPRIPYEPGFLEDFASRIDRVRRERGIEKWHVVGHDAGSAVAVQYAHQFPECINRLALLTPAIFPELEPFLLFKLLRRPIIGEMLAPAVNFLFWKIAMRYAIKAENETSRNVVKDFCAPFSGLSGAWRLMSIMRWGEPAEVLGRLPSFLPNLAAPTVIFHGRRDPAVPYTFARRASDLIPNSRVVLLDSGHYIPLNDAELLAGELTQFFAGQPHQPDKRNQTAYIV